MMMTVLTNMMLSRLSARPWCHALLLTLPLCFTACRDTQVAVYRIPKEVDPAPAANTTSSAMTGPAVASASGRDLTWTAPTSWKTKAPSSMRKASYTVGEEGGASADFAITAFPGDVGGNLANVNRWRGQLQLPPISEAELASALTPISANGLNMLVVDLAGTAADNTQRMLGAIVPYDGATWFFKLTGPAAVVEREKTRYLALLQTVKPAVSPAPTTAAPLAPPPPATDMANTAVIKAEGPGLKWTTPPHWQSKPASAMRKATFIVPGENSANAELAVTAFPGDVGGELANVNRWRGQLQLPPLTEAELGGAVTRVTSHGLQVTLVDLTSATPGQPQRMLGAIVPYEGATWFFKLTGAVPLIAREQPAFLAFIQTLQAP